MSEKIKNSPKLRFPEFVNDKDWEEKVLGSKDVSHSISSGKDKNDSNGKFDLYGSTGIIGKSLNGSYSGNFILVARVGANAGFLTKVNGRFGVTDNTLVVDLHKAVNIDFIFSSLEIFRLNKLVFGSGQPLITGGQLKAISIFLPKPKEQQKIADCLSSVDSLISAQSQKAELLKEHKKALMQQLFPQDGEEVPKLRFPEFKNAPKWEEKKLGDLLDYEQPTNYLVSDTNYNDSFEIPVLTAGKTFILGYTNETHGIFQNPLPVIIFDDFTTATQFVDFPFKAKSSAMKILKPKDDFGNIKIIFELMQTIEYQANEHKRYWISEYQNLEIKLPSPKEQQKIANCLSSLDEQISQQTTKLQTLKEHKKALMQQLFPTKEV